MAYQQLDLILVSGNDLKGVHPIGKMAVYAIANLSNDPRSEQRTLVDKVGGKNPIWNCPMRFFIATANHDVIDLRIQLKSKRCCLVNRDVGEVRINIRELFLTRPANSVRYRVINPSGEYEGFLNISYRIGGEVPPPQPPFTAYLRPAGAYPPPQQAYVYGAPPPQLQPGYGYGYGYPPQPQGYGYGYPPQPQGYGYGYPPQPQGYGYGYPRWPWHSNFRMVFTADVPVGDLDAGGPGLDYGGGFAAGDSGFDDGGYVDF